MIAHGIHGSARGWANRVATRSSFQQIPHVEHSKNEFPRRQASAGAISSKDTTPIVIESILVPWLAFQNQSALAAEALVETVVSLYRSGWTVEAVQMELTFLTLESQQEAIQQVQELDSEMLLSFICLIMITCQETECPFFDSAPSNPAPEGKSSLEGQSSSSSAAARLQGLQQYARQTLQQYTNGATLRGMQKKQEKARTAMKHSPGVPGMPGAAPQSMSPNMLFMQNLTRIVLLTIESLQQQGLALPRPALIQMLRQKFGMAGAPPLQKKSVPSARIEATQFARHLHPDDGQELKRDALLAGSGAVLSLMQKRWLAVRLLLAFMGATMGWSLSWQVFIDTALLAYMAGATAQDVYDSLHPEEFSQAGQMFKAAASASTQSEKINAEVFARWLSNAYMTWALMGLSHPASGSSTGWAWVPVQLDMKQDSSVVAHAMSEFVASNLRQLQAQDDPRPEDNRTLGNVAVNSGETVDRKWLAQRLGVLRAEAMQDKIAKGMLSAKVEDPDLARSSSAMTYMAQQSAIVQMCWGALNEYGKDIAR